MVSREARIFLVEDAPMIEMLAKEALETDGHKIVREAETLPQALEIISRLNLEEIDVAVVDGNLSQGMITGEDGRQIAAVIRQAAPRVKIICFSAYDYGFGDSFVDKNTWLDDDNSNPLAAAVTNVLKGR